jgi:glycosyltransferase involved in cell wall biosynthesis
VIGFEKLRQTIMPQVWSRFSEARLRVVAGPEPERYCRLSELDPRIQIHGFVEDLRPLYGSAAVVVVPLEVSAGTNIKVMEAMACARAVVSTPVGCAGLGLEDGREALIRATPPDFAAAICELLADPDRRRCLAGQARRTAEQRFSWNVISGQAYASYLELAP